MQPNHSGGAAHPERAPTDPPSDVSRLHAELDTLASNRAACLADQASLEARRETLSRAVARREPGASNEAEAVETRLAVLSRALQTLADDEADLRAALEIAERQAGRGEALSRCVALSREAAGARSQTISAWNDLNAAAERLARQYVEGLSEWGRLQTQAAALLTEYEISEEDLEHAGGVPVAVRRTRGGSVLQPTDLTNAGRHLAGVTSILSVENRARMARQASDRTAHGERSRSDLAPESGGSGIVIDGVELKL